MKVKLVRTIVVLIVAVLVPTSGVQGADPRGPWDLDTLFEVPQWEKTELASKPEMKGLLYDSLPYLGKPVQVFAYYSAPKGPVPEGGWPAVVCIHGGGGTAFDFWVQTWNDRGYAAISMDLEGHLPIASEQGEGRRQSTPNPGPQRAGVFANFEKPLDQQWYYHAVAQVILSHSLLRSFPEVNPEKIGVTGISWGGNLTSTVMGLDTRFKFAIAGYGCGFLSDSSGHQGRAIKPGRHKEIVDTYYDGSAYFENVAYPTLWVNGTNDFHFDMPAMQKSAQAVNGPATIRFLLEMGHGHGPVIKTKECYIFADSVVKGGVPLPDVSQPTADGNLARADYSSSVKIEDAQLLYTTDSTSIWPDKKWHSAPAIVEDLAVSATLPSGTYAFYFTLTDHRGAMVSSEFLQHSVPGGGQKSAPETLSKNMDIDFDALFKKAVGIPGAKVIIADNFEQGVSDHVRDILKVDDPDEKAGIVECNDRAASGGKSLKMINSPTVAHVHQPILSQWFRGDETINSGTIQIALDMLIPSEGDNKIFVGARDYTTEPMKEYVTLFGTPVGVRLNNNSYGFAKDQWIHLTLSWPVGVAGGTLKATITDSHHGTRQVELPIDGNLCEAISWIGFSLPGKNDGAIYIDNLVLTVVDDQ